MLTIKTPETKFCCYQDLKPGDTFRWVTACESEIRMVSDMEGYICLENGEYYDNPGDDRQVVIVNCTLTVES